MFVIYELDGGEYWLARTASRVPVEGRYLGVVELEEAEPLLYAVLERWNAGGWREASAGSRGQPQGPGRRDRMAPLS